MSYAIYALCALTSLACTVLLTRSYLRSSHRLLFWSALCFLGLTFNNVLLFLDKLVVSSVDLLLYRLLAGLIALLLLLYGLIYEQE